MPSLPPPTPRSTPSSGNVWNITGADHGGITWPVTAAYVVMFTAAAILNVGLVSIVVDALRRRRTARVP